LHPFHFILEAAALSRLETQENYLIEITVPAPDPDLSEPVEGMFFAGSYRVLVAQLMFLPPISSP
jgi:hypothetical protein